MTVVSCDLPFCLCRIACRWNLRLTVTMLWKTMRVGMSYSWNKAKKWRRHLSNSQLPKCQLFQMNTTDRMTLRKISSKSRGFYVRPIPSRSWRATARVVRADGGRTSPSSTPMCWSTSAKISTILASNFQVSTRKYFIISLYSILY